MCARQRTDYPRSNASRWASSDDWWRHYHATGFNTFVVGWLGISRDHGKPPYGVGGHGYGTMLDYLGGLGLDSAPGDPGILPILNVLNTQELANAKTVAARVDAAGKMGANFANTSILGYYVYDEPSPVRSHRSLASRAHPAPLSPLRGGWAGAAARG